MYVESNVVENEEDDYEMKVLVGCTPYIFINVIEKMKLGQKFGLI